MNKKIHPLSAAGFLLLLVAGLNWGLVGLFDFNMINSIFGKVPLLERIIYVVMGLSAIVIILEVVHRVSISGHQKPAHSENHNLFHI